MKALVLAAGYAVRLAELTKNTPKPFLPINNKRIIDRIIDKIAAIREVGAIYIITNAKFFPAFVEWRKTSPHRDRVSLMNDGTTTNETRLGAIKDMELAIDKKNIDDDLLVVAGDNLFDFELMDFLRFASKRPDSISIAVYDIKDKALAGNFGVVTLVGDKRMDRFEEKPENPGSTLISTGIYYFPKNKIPLLKKYVAIQDKKLDAPGYFMSWAVKNDRVSGFAFREDWYDIGSIESYRKADSDYARKEK